MKYDNTVASALASCQHEAKSHNAPIGSSQGFPAGQLSKRSRVRLLKVFLSLMTSVSDGLALQDFGESLGRGRKLIERMRSPEKYGDDDIRCAHGNIER